MEPRTIFAIIDRQAKDNADRTAIAAPGRDPLPYRGLCEQVASSVAYLNGLGLGRNERIAIVLPNGPELAAAFLSVASGMTAAPLNPAYGAREFEFYLSDLGARALIVPRGEDTPAVEVARALGVEVIELVRGEGQPAGTFSLLAARESRPVASPQYAQPEDTALVLHTSGTTSRPKIVPLTQASLSASAFDICASLSLRPDDRCLNIMPLFHVHGLVGALLSSLAAGASIVCSPGFYAPQFFEWVDECRPTWYTAVPTMHQAILQRASENRTIARRRPFRFIRSCSAALAPQLIDQLESTFNVPVVEAYGMTEASHQIAINPLPPGVRKPGSVGLPSGTEIGIMDEAGNLLPPGSLGEIVLRGPKITPAYENNPQANREAFVNGWFRTGDQGYLDEDSYLFITGRIKEIINRGGEKISPREIDEVLLRHPAIAQAVAFAVPDPRLGEAVAAAVVLKEGQTASEQELKEHAARHLAYFKVPQTIVFVDEIPKGPTGKLQRVSLAATLGLKAGDGQQPPQDDAPRRYVAPRNPVEERLAAIWAEVLRLERVGMSDVFVEVGGDSMLALRVVALAQDAFGVDITLQDFLSKPTVEAMAEVITAKLRT